MDKQKEIKKLRTQKAKFRRQGNLKLVAEYANSIGNLCSEIGEYRQAIEEHECELAICQDQKDIEGEAIANRKLGECYMELVDLEAAKEYVTKYIDLARTLPKKIELQRSFVTMGRLCLIEIPTLIPGTARRKQSEKKAENSFMKALEWCNKIKSGLETSEYQEMRARAILNLGLLADMKNEMKEASENIKNASIIAKKYSLHKTYVTCLINLAEMQMRNAKFAEARATLEDAMSYNQKYDSGHIVETSKLFAQVTVEMGDVGVGLDTVKMVLRKLEGDSREELTKVAIKLFKIIVAKRKLPLSNDDDKRKIFEKIGDYCCDVGAYHHALLSYQKTLDIINQMELKHEILVPILISMARTYQDLKNYDQAINYFCQEAKIQQQLGNFDQAARSLLSVANCMENGNTNIDMICQCYKKAESHSRNAADKKLQLLVLKNFRDSMKALDNTDKYEECCKKIEQIKVELGLDLESQAEDEGQNSEGDDGSDSSDGGFELSDHSSDEERESEVVKSTRCRPFKILRNELGETKLHQAVIKGKIDVVRDLISKGHPVNIRDHAGWSPLHEAAIHDYVEIARVLVDHGADFSDRAGKDGVTPIHDACGSGCSDTIQYLMEAGASVIAKDNNNKYPLDYLIEYLSNAYEDLDEETRQIFEDLESMIRTSMSRKGITPKPKPFKVQYQEKLDDITAAMPDIKLLTKSNKEGCESEEYQAVARADLSLSPHVSATEMYRSAVANVRKSAKRVAPPCAKDTLPQTEGPMLIRDNCDDNLMATGDWLIDDYNEAPATKKQKFTELAPPNKKISSKAKATRRRQTSHQSSPRVIEETPEKGLESSPGASSVGSVDTKASRRPLRKSRRILDTPKKTQDGPSQPTGCRENTPDGGPARCDLDESSAKKQEQDAVTRTNPSRGRKRFQIPSPMKDISSQQQIQPLSPAFHTPSHCKKMDTISNGLDLGLNDSFTQLLGGPTIFETHRKGDTQDGCDADTATMPSSLSQISLFDSETVDKVIEEFDKGEDPEVGSKKTSSVTQNSEPVTKGNLAESPSDILSIQWSQDKAQSTKSSPSPNLSEIYAAAPSTVSKLVNTGIEKCSNPKETSNSVIDEIFGEQPAKGRGATKASAVSGNKANSKTSNAVPTSTPLRKNRMLPETTRISPIPTSIGKCDTSHRTQTRHNDSKDSGFPNAPLNNTSLSAIKPSIQDTANGTLNTNSNILADINNSYYQNIRILVQWKNRTLLIPVSRCDSYTIGWLSDELVRRLTKRRSSSGGPALDPCQVILTRASDGAELFHEDLITDILVDNEKVVALTEDEI